MIPGCMMQLCSHFTGGLMTMYDSNLDDTLERFAGAWIQSGWFLYLGASLALAIDRTLTFVIVVSDRNAVLISYLFLALSWAIALLYL
uniref:Ammonium_transp domain-containing protein n=1 Tax=Steinernema glaseri TaxID=37863 RepID=A0A1I8AAK4_9BILA